MNEDKINTQAQEPGLQKADLTSSVIYAHPYDKSFNYGQLYEILQRASGYLTFSRPKIKNPVIGGLVLPNSAQVND